MVEVGNTIPWLVAAGGFPFWSSDKCKFFTDIGLILSWSISFDLKSALNV
jgi:hypothetical protein